MPQYKVIRTCFGFKGRHWPEGTIVHLAEGENPPRHFELMDKNEPEARKPEPEEPKTFSEINKANEEKRPDTGMLHKYQGHKGKSSKK